MGTPSTPKNSYYFTSIFTNTVEIANDVYYSTQNIDARFYDYRYINNNSYLNLEYYLDVDSKTTTSLTTRITGFFNYPLFQLFTYRYLLIFPNNPWLNDYIRI
jgi:hypothetical protein